MPSTTNRTRACPNCYVGTNKEIHDCGTETVVVDLGPRINLPRKGNRRAWKRIFNGEKAWNRRKSRGKRGPDTFTVYEWEYYGEPIERDCDCQCCNMLPPQRRRRRVPGSGTEKVNYNRKPDVDLGG